MTTTIYTMGKILTFESRCMIFEQLQFAICEHVQINFEEETKNTNKNVSLGVEKLTEKRCIENEVYRFPGQKN